MVLMLAPIIKDDIICRIVCVSIFIVASLTDMLDGKIARKYNLVTNFGKLMDPLADKFMVFGALLAMLVKYDYLQSVFVWAAAVIMFRELAVSSLRLLAAGKKDPSASWLGKVKTVSQIVMICAVMLEPVVLPFPIFTEMHLLSYITIIATIVMTVWSGISYFVSYSKVIDFKN
jgi:CDP-diacylglycerol--glycerol-3-phosphate 3-phosphatidyltransferase/cardiolipin synthase